VEQNELVYIVLPTELAAVKEHGTVEAATEQAAVLLARHPSVTIWARVTVVRVKQPMVAHHSELGAHLAASALAAGPDDVKATFPLDPMRPSPLQAIPRARVVEGGHRQLGSGEKPNPMLVCQSGPGEGQLHPAPWPLRACSSCGAPPL
jgi:hypothetical protein